jgi:outer membrane protein assembly factor BamE
MCNLSILRYPVILLAILCASCGTALPTVKPYKLDVQQGNVVTSKMLLQLRPGMTQSQVRFIMGTPLIQDSFHGKRWDYVYQMREKGKITEQRRVILDFENDLLKTVRGDVVPSGSDVTKPDDAAANTGTRVVNPSAKTEEKSLLAKLKFWEKDEAELAEEAAAVKAKAEADEVAKNAAELAKENLANKQITQENLTPIIAETKSMLAVPMEIPPVVEAPAVVVPTIEATPVTESVTVGLPQTEAVVAASVPHAVEKPAVVIEEPALKLTASTAYHSPSGMQFDRALRLASENAEPIAKPEVIAPRAGNKTIPKPKDLPAESSPSFFDRMLEKIGF